MLNLFALVNIGYLSYFGCFCACVAYDFHKIKYTWLCGAGIEQFKPRPQAATDFSQYTPTSGDHDMGGASASVDAPQ